MPFALWKAAVDMEKSIGFFQMLVNVDFRTTIILCHKLYIHMGENEAANTTWFATGSAPLIAIKICDDSEPLLGLLLLVVYFHCLARCSDHVCIIHYECY